MNKIVSIDPQVIETFNQELDHLLNTGEQPPDVQQDALHKEMLSIAQTLANADLTALSQSRASLRQSLLAKQVSPAHRPMPWKVKLIATVALLLVIAVAAFAISPPLRAWAQEVLARVGNLIITDAPTQAEQALPRLLTATPKPVRTLEPLSQDEASRRAGFTVLVPRNTPKTEKEDIYAPPWGASRVDRWDIYERPNGVAVAGTYNRWYSVRILQLKLAGEKWEEFPIGGADVDKITVRGQTGYWIEGAATSIIGGGGSIFQGMKDIDWHLAHNDILAWEEKGIVYVIMGDDELSLDDLMAIAESLAP